MSNRGPGQQVCTVFWDRRKDKFSLGQWLKGRIYEDRCDISPDGRHFIYFALNGRWASESRGSWTAVSRVPYLKALAFYPAGTTYGGGGLFLGKTEYWASVDLQAGYRESQEVTRVGEMPPLRASHSIQEIRLLNGGWIHRGRHRFERPLIHGWTLRQTLESRRTRVELARGEIATVQPGWEWADYEPERLLWAAQGALWAAHLTSGGLGKPRVLHDFNGMRFERITAPY